MQNQELNNDQIREAIGQAIFYCRMSDEARRAGTGEYEFLSLRGVLYTLGYSEIEADSVIYAAAESGFDYCVDPLIRVKDSGWPDGDKRNGQMIVPSTETCYWGADQLLSRLHCVRIYD